jgi:hypothetical protein
MEGIDLVLTKCQQLEELNICGETFDLSVVPPLLKLKKFYSSGITSATLANYS